MIPDHREIICDLTVAENNLIAASKAGDANAFYQTLSSIERLAAFHKNRMIAKQVLDISEEQDDDL
jgi:hypothetical protein